MLNTYDMNEDLPNAASPLKVELKHHNSIHVKYFSTYRGLVAMLLDKQQAGIHFEIVSIQELLI